ncbi:MAG: heparinase II/III family protein, partial [Rhizobiaceae bacterium]
FKTSKVIFTGSQSRPIERLDRDEQSELKKQANQILAGKAKWYGWKTVDIRFPYDWQFNPFTKQRAAIHGQHWSEISEPHPTGDIKDIWEQSRFEWAVVLAQGWLVFGHQKYLDGLNLQLTDWMENNPINSGTQWMCGQETSIRLLNFLQALALLNEKPNDTTLEFIAAHIQRVSYGLSYAIGQNNNHGTSESVCLAVAGAYLEKYSPPGSPNITLGASAKKQGIKWSNERCSKLFFEDGGFSQYSISYHRLALETLVLSLEWSKRLDCQKLAAPLLKNTVQRAYNWLIEVTDPSTGDAPNLGANDGANPYRQLPSAGYRDFRPTMARCALALGAPIESHLEKIARNLKALKVGEGGDLQTASKKKPSNIWVAKDFSYAKLTSTSGKFSAFLRGSNFRFRPAHSDFGHVDVWFQHKPILIDCGTFRYTSNTNDPVLDLAAAQSHNCLLINDRDPMIRLSRFLFGDWLDGPLSQVNERTLEVRRKFESKGLHTRALSIDDEQVCIRDKLIGASGRITIRWHLAGTDWILRSPNEISNGVIILKCETQATEPSFSLDTAKASLHYAKTNDIQVLTISFPMPDDGTALITTTLQALNNSE